MPSFAVGQTIETRDPVILVNEGLKVGSHRFQLVVRDTAGNASRPDVATIAVQREVVTDPVVSPNRPDTNSRPSLAPVVNAVAAPPERTAAPAVRTTRKPRAVTPAAPPSKPRKPRK